MFGAGTCYGNRATVQPSDTINNHCPYNTKLGGVFPVPGNPCDHLSYQICDGCLSDPATQNTTTSALLMGYMTELLREGRCEQHPNATLDWECGTCENTVALYRFAQPSPNRPWFFWADMAAGTQGYVEINGK